VAFGELAFKGRFLGNEFLGQGLFFFEGLGFGVGSQFGGEVLAAYADAGADKKDEPEEKAKA
jgi:hypothetical protein